VQVTAKVDRPLKTSCTILKLIDLGVTGRDVSSAAGTAMEGHHEEVVMVA
jgi:hypothetical protein